MYFAAASAAASVQTSLRRGRAVSPASSTALTEALSVSTRLHHRSVAQESTESSWLYLPDSVPQFAAREVEVGEELGHGEFGIVFGINKLYNNSNIPVQQPSRLNSDHFPVFQIEVHKDEEYKASSDDELDLMDGQDNQDALLQAKTRLTEKSASRYAIKHLQESSLSSMEAQMDVFYEAKFLQSIRHSNIIRLRGIVGEPGDEDYGLILDRLTKDTLHDVLHKWKKSAWKSTWNHSEAKNRHGIRLEIALDVGRALRHLHRHSIVYRDLKPDNIGFHVRDHQIKLFDFGLATQLEESNRVSTDAYLLTGLTGTRRYMSPQVVLCEPYGASADVYSFAMLMWQVWALQTPFRNYTVEQHKARVIIKGERPRGKVPFASMLQRMWAEDPKERPSMAEVCDFLTAELKKVTSDIGSIDRSRYFSEKCLKFMFDADEVDV